MGYYTAYTLTWEPKDEAVSDFINDQQEGEGNFAYGISPTGEMTDPVKWYDHDLDMSFLSKHFPKILFTLSGEGEESGDIWRKYYKNGKSQTVKAEITFAKFDARKLK